MRRVLAFVRAVLLGTIMGSVCMNAASADGVDDEKTVLFFSGSDVWRHGLFSHGGLLWSPGGLDRPGFTFKVLLGGGRYGYRSGALENATVVGDQDIAFAMPGWRFQNGRLTISLFAGLDVQHHRFMPDDPSNSLRGINFGVRGGFDLWFDPTNQSMIAMNASISSVGPSYSARLAFGWQVSGGFYVGPEIGGFANGDNYNQFRLGAHVTGFKILDTDGYAGFGWTFDNDNRTGLYGSLGFLVRN